MFSKPKTSRRKYSDEMVGIILALCETGKSYAQIADQVKVLWLSEAQIIHRVTRTQNEPCRPTNRAGCPLKLDILARRALIWHMERNTHDNLTTLGTLSKSGTTLSCKTVRAYLKTVGYLRFKVQKKLYLTEKHKEAQLRLAREYLRWTLKDWKWVIWTDEATFEICLGSRIYYITQKPGIAMESRNLKSKFKSRRTTLGIWGAITLGKKEPVHFLIKKGRMTSQIYVD